MITGYEGFILIKLWIVVYGGITHIFTFKINLILSRQF